MTEKPVALPSQPSKHVDAGLGDSADVTIYSGGAQETDVNYTSNSVDGPVAQLGRRQVALPSSPAPTESAQRWCDVRFEVEDFKVLDKASGEVVSLVDIVLEAYRVGKIWGESVPSTPSPTLTLELATGACRAKDALYGDVGVPATPVETASRKENHEKATEGR